MHHLTVQCLSQDEFMKQWVSQACEQSIHPPTQIRHAPLASRSLQPATSRLSAVIVAVHDVETHNRVAMACITAARLYLQRTGFIVLVHPAATEDPILRTKAFDLSANMVTYSQADLSQALKLVQEQSLTGRITCNWCGLKKLTQLDYFKHQPLYHADEPDLKAPCLICRTPENVHLTWHIHACHGPPEHTLQPRTGVFALAVVRRRSDGRFLLVQEAGGQGYWLPGGGVDPGESLTAGALRETLEEGGLQVNLIGVLKVQVARDFRWRRVIFYAEPVSEEELPKTLPDIDSAGACWVSVEQLQHIPLRSVGELQWLPALAAGKVGWLPLKMPDEYAEAFSDWAF